MTTVSAHCPEHGDQKFTPQDVILYEPKNKKDDHNYSFLCELDPNNPLTVRKKLNRIYIDPLKLAGCELLHIKLPIKIESQPTQSENLNQIEIKDQPTQNEDLNQQASNLSFLGRLALLFNKNP